MSSESASPPLTPRLVRPGSEASRRVALRLTAGERKSLLLLVDLLLLNGALLAVVAIWHEVPLTLPVLWANVKWFLTLSALWWLVGTVFDVYDLARSASTTNIAVHAGPAALLTALLYLAIPWLTPTVPSRVYALTFVLLGAVAVVGWRALYARALVQPGFRRRALVLGADGPAQALIRALQQAGQLDDANPFRGTGYRIVGLVADRPAEEREAARDDLPRLGGLDQLVRLTRQYNVDEIIVALDEERTHAPEVHEILLDCRELGLPVSSLAAVYERLTGRLPVDYARRDVHLVLGLADSPISRLYAALKRLMDVGLALGGLIAMAPLIPWVALGNALFSPGPLFYRQQRVGRGGRPFALLKFRSMVPDAEENGVTWCGEGDPRITPVGRLLRKTRLDELPQLLNVLRGEMSIVGPRPERPYFVGELSRALPLYRARHAVKPGLTGWAQVRYRYGSTLEEGRIKLEYDLYYVKHANLALDLLILLQTVRVVLGFMGR